MKVLILGDVHFPYHSKKAMNQIFSAVKAEKPSHIVQIGDLYDQYGFSRFSKKNIDLPEKELSKARSLAVSMWQKLRSLSGFAKCYQLLGNHDVRLLKRAQEKLPEAQELVRQSLMELYTFRGVTTLEDDREELIINGIVFMHGYRSRIGDHMRFNGKSTVVGHSHTGGVVYEQKNNKILWELNAGYLADETAEPLRYRPQTTSKWTIGYGLIDSKGPRFVPLEKK